MAPRFLEKWVGLTILVGVQNVIDEPDGSYLFANPGARQRWTVAVAGLGISIAQTGVLVFLQRKQK